ncbi:MAG: hypothetical protein ISP77_01725 [Methylophilaceae bacterium]|nr:hypothetical protein [Methylophilaceae bacterium]MBL6728697.1 hypothetical protein [Methylophilaceae bacterium]
MENIKIKNVKKILLNFVLTWTFILIVIEIFALFSLWSINKIVQIEGEKLYKISEINSSLKSADSNFKSQVQAWKNILIRGQVNKDYKKYKFDFNKKYAITQNKINGAYEECISSLSLIDCNRIKTIQEAHESLKNAYFRNLNLEELMSTEGYKIIDGKVRGIDRDLQIQFFQVTQEVNILFENKQNEFVELVSQRYQQIRFFLLVTLALAMSFILLKLYRILKIDSKDL